MIQLSVLSGKMAGSTYAARHFPFKVGRDADSDLQTDAHGVWAGHLSFFFVPRKGIRMQCAQGASAIVNGTTVTDAFLRNGDTIDVGALKFRFWMGETQCRSQRWREWMTWLMWAAMVIAEVLIIYALR